MKAISRIACLIAGAALLGGCQSSPLTSWMFKGNRPSPEQGKALAGNAAGALQDGRELLRQGQISAAIATFRIALLDPASRAEASNGLAVAYAKLGRADLAERYFHAAISADPENTQFVANLLRLQQQVMLARRAAVPETLASIEPRPERRREEPLMMRGPAERVSRSEVRIHARPDMGDAPAMAVAYRDASDQAVGAEAAPTALANARPVHPVRIAFPE